MITTAFPPHGVCWFWNWKLIALHLLGDVGTGIFYLWIPTLALYIYKTGQLEHLRAAYPKLWRRGAAFVLLCGLNHFGAAAEIWSGGWLYYLTGINKICMMIASGLFFQSFWKRRQDLIIAGRILERSITILEEEQE